MKKRILFISAALLHLAGCSGPEGCSDPGDCSALRPVSFRISSGSLAVSYEDLIWDINLYITDTDGDMEDYAYLQTRGENVEAVTFNLMREQPYCVYVMANAGYEMGRMSRNDLLSYKYYLRYPDSFDHGMPMSGVVEDFVIRGDSTEIVVPLERLLAKISLRMDCSQLDDGVKMNLFSARIGNCPRCVSPFTESVAESSADFFPTGYTCTFSDKYFTLYCLENCQYSPDKELSSYVELDIDYLSETMESPPGRGVIYRFYLRENDDFCVRRGSLYNVTVTPTGDGTLTDDSWRIDSSSLRER